MKVIITNKQNDSQVITGVENMKVADNEFSFHFKNKGVYGWFAYSLKTMKKIEIVVDN
jgi:hypothetical protein|tara:strand:+ start:1648 stop:1821 length:174 start_codon:yes stop_codon:yes gene_type:complete